MTLGKFGFGLLFVLSIPLISLAQTTTDATSTVATASPPVVSSPTNEGIEQKVHEYFANVPIMAEIARCESKFRQFNSSGAALDGGAGGMIGVFQINSHVHAQFAKERGMDIYTLEGNLAYAKYLYEREGTNPWISSFSCWGTTSPGAVTGTGGGALTSTLTLGVISPEVLTLQKILNASGFPVATEGPGSPGQETTKFGALTRIAVRKFQCAKNIACDGDEYSTGYGMVGVKTRAALLALNTSSTVPPPQSVSETDTEIKRIQALILELTAQLLVLQKAKQPL